MDAMKLKHQQTLLSPSKAFLSLLASSVNHKENQKLISLGIGDPTVFSCFQTTHDAQEAVVEALQSRKFNGYAPTAGLPQTRRAIAEYLSRDLPYKLSSEDVFVTSGCTQATEVALSILARPGANMLFPRPVFPIYDLCASFRNLEVRFYDLIPKKGWEVSLDSVKGLADNNTVGLVIINPGNPCGNVYTYQHLQNLRIPVVADEVYEHLVFGDRPFVPMGIFGSIAPVITLGSLSKRWIVLGWRWLSVSRSISRS